MGQLWKFNTENEDQRLNGHWNLHKLLFIDWMTTKLAIKQKGWRPLSILIELVTLQVFYFNSCKRRCYSKSDKRAIARPPWPLFSVFLSQSLCAAAAKKGSNCFTLVNLSIIIQKHIYISFLTMKCSSCDQIQCNQLI